MSALTLIVRSSDGVDFAVATDTRAIPYELAFAKAKTSTELEAHGDFVRVDGPATLTDTTPAPEPQDETPAEWPTLELPRTCDAAHEALCRAQARWHTAAVIQGDKP